MRLVQEAQKKCADLVEARCKGGEGEGMGVGDIEGGDTRYILGPSGGDSDAGSSAVVVCQAFGYAGVPGVRLSIHLEGGDGAVDGGLLGECIEARVPRIF